MHLREFLAIGSLGAKIRYRQQTPEFFRKIFPHLSPDNTGFGVVVMIDRHLLDQSEPKAEIYVHHINHPDIPQFVGGRYINLEIDHDIEIVEAPNPGAVVVYETVNHAQRLLHLAPTLDAAHDWRRSKDVRGVQFHQIPQHTLFD